MPELTIIGAKEDNRYFPYQNAFRVMRKTFYQAGQDSFTAPPAQNPDSFQSLVNIEPVTKGILNRRRGYSLLSSQSPATPYKEGYSFRSESKSLRSQVWTSTSNVLVLNEDGSPNINTLFAPSINAKFAPRMVLSNNYGYFADGLLADYQKWDGTSVAGNLTNWGIDINNVTGFSFGPNGPGTATDLGGGPSNFTAGPNTGSSVAYNIPAPSGTQAWTSLGGGVGSVQIDNGSGSLFSDYLRITNFGFALPTTATVTGVLVTVNRDASKANEAYDNSVRLVVGLNEVGTEHASGNPWPVSSANATYGSSSDTWVGGLLYSDVNSSAFGIAFSVFGLGNYTSAYANIRSVTITVYYSAPSAGSWTNPNNIKLNDGAVATATATVAASSFLQATNFALAPTGTPIGIQVDIKCSTSSGTPSINPVLVKGGNAFGTPKTATISSNSLGFISFGGPNDLWGGLWGVGDINGSTTFGVQFSINALTGSPVVSVDYVRITVYTLAGAPSVAISGVGITLLSGRVYAIAFQNSSTGHVSHFSGFSASTGALTNQGISVTNIPVSLDSQVDTKLILATADGGDTTTLYLIATIPNATTSYADTMTDSTLLTQPIYQQTNQDGTLHGVANNKRPPAINYPTKHKGRIYGSIQGTLYFSKNLDEVTTSTGTITSKWEEAWPATNAMDVSETAETIQGIMSDGETLWLATERCIRRLIGDSPSNFQKPEIQFNEAGLLNMDSWKITFKEDNPIGTMWITPDFRVMWSDFNTYQDVGAPIQNLLNSINLSAVSQIHGCFVAKGPAEYYMLYLPTGTNAYPDTVCVYNLKSAKWFIWKPTDFVSSSLYFIDASGIPRWTFATQAGSLYEWKDTITQDRVNNTAVSYSATMITPWLDFGDEGLTKAFNKMIVTTSDTTMTIGIQGAIRDTDLDSGGVTVLPPTLLQPEIFGDLFIPLVGSPGFYKWYQITFTSPVNAIVDVLDGFDIEIMPSMRM